jgi:hypothetical protein
VVIHVRAGELKAADLDWTEVQKADVENLRARLAAQLLASGAHDSTASRVNAFTQQGGVCRATLFNDRHELVGNGSDDRSG